ncbi:hypothetical protein BDZ91DRAFT_177921 [Kalaharituber pfeilii]|nr:hypothetical protein BDZ91DRAFT_177921 [Kalaharituber pfeilii]
MAYNYPRFVPQHMPTENGMIILQTNFCVQVLLASNRLARFEGCLVSLYVICLLSLRFAMGVKRKISTESR